MKSGDKVTIGIVNDGKIDSLLCLDLLHLLKMPNTKFEHLVQVGNKGLTTRSRNIVCKTYLETTKCEWLLLVDSDQRLPMQSWIRLIDAAHDKERPIMTGLVFAAFFDENDNLRAVPTIYNDDPELGLQPIDDYPEDSVIEVDAAGTGCLLLHRSVIEDLREKATTNQGKDWSWFFEGAIGGTYFGEDLLFSKRLKSLGYKIHAHTGAILPHHKDFWLSSEHHAGIRQMAIEKKNQKQEDHL